MIHTFIHVKGVKVLDDYNLLLTFEDGTVKMYDMKPELWGRLFEPLKEPNSFKKVYIESGTIKWPNGAEICHDKLYRNSSEVRQELLH
jgi:hypothetical protein